VQGNAVFVIHSVFFADFAAVLRDPCGSSFLAAATSQP